MKTSSITTEHMASMRTSHHSPEPIFSALRHALHEFFTKLDQMEIAIVLSEAGDVEGAKALLEKHAK